MDINKELAELAQYKMMLEETKAEVEKIEARLKDYMTANAQEVLIGDEHKVTYKAVTSSRFDSTAFKKEHADMYEAYKKASTSMRFTFA